MWIMRMWEWKSVKVKTRKSAKIQKHKKCICSPSYGSHWKRHKIISQAGSWGQRQACRATQETSWCKCCNSRRRISTSLDVLVLWYVEANSYVGVLLSLKEIGYNEFPSLEKKSFCHIALFLFPDLCHTLQDKYAQSRPTVWQKFRILRVFFCENGSFWKLSPRFNMTWKPVPKLW